MAKGKFARKNKAKYYMVASLLFSMATIVLLLTSICSTKWKIVNKYFILFTDIV